jgi:di/tricarboxylate transporter
MRQFSPLQLIVIAGVLLVLGAVLPFLMVIRLLEPSFALSFFSYGASLVGLVMGLIGIAQYGRRR